MLFGVGIKAVFYYGHAENVASKPILGITLPLWMGIGGMILGAIIMVISRPYFASSSRARPKPRRRGSSSNPPTGPVPPRVDFWAGQPPFSSGDWKSVDPGDFVEAAVEAEDPSDLAAAHHRDVNRVAGGEPGMSVTTSFAMKTSSFSTANTSSTISLSASNATAIRSRRPRAR